jgi:hypothetical protein
MLIMSYRINGFERSRVAIVGLTYNAKRRLEYEYGAPE